MGADHETLSFVPRLTACFFSNLFASRFKEAGLRIPFDRPLGHEPFGRELRVERLEAEWLRAAVSPIPKPRKERRPPTRPPSTSSARASRGELVAGRQSLQKGFHGLAGQENCTSKKDIYIPRDAIVAELKQ
jgi:hypothetical protein